MASNTFILLGTSGCHLCEKAEKLLHQISTNVTLRKVDIAEQVEFYDSYALKIPVLYHPASDRSLCWPFETNDVDNFIKALSHE